MYEVKLLLRDKSFVREIVTLSEEKRKAIFLRNCRVILSDFSMLHIKEIWKDNQLLKYSYFWFTANDTLILGWDNAPHHPRLNSFPHHKHTVEGVEASNERDLPDIVEYIGDIF